MKEIFLNNISSQDKILFYDVPLLYEKNMEHSFDQIILVHCEEEEQLRRLCLRDKISVELAKEIIKSQMKIDEKIQKENFKIDNNLNTKNEFKDLREQIKKTLTMIIALWN